MATSKASSKAGKKKAVETEDQLLSRLVHIEGRCVVLDTETTGLSPQSGDRLVEIGCVEIVDRKLTGRRFHAYIDPQFDVVPPEAVAVHGLTATFLRGKPTFRQVYPSLLKFIEGAEIVIHNAPFDVGFLNQELQDAGANDLSSYVSKVTDTLAIAREVWHQKKNTLDAVADRLSVNRSNRVLHGALLDAEILAEVYLRMGKGQNDLTLAGGATVEEIKQKDIQKADAIEIDGSSIVVLQANADEIAAHNAYMADIDKGNKNLSIWSKFDRGLNPLESYSLEGKPDVKAPPPPPPVESSEDEIPPPPGNAPAKGMEIIF